MSALIAPVSTLVPTVRPAELATVIALRRQIARGASSAVLMRIAGGVAPYARLAKEHGLPPMRALHAAPPVRSAGRVPAGQPGNAGGGHDAGHLTVKPEVARVVPPVPGPQDLIQDSTAAPNGGGRRRRHRKPSVPRDVAALVRAIARVDRQLAALERR